MTFGNNINSGSWGVREEDNSGRTDIHSTVYDISYDQATSMHGFAAGLIADPQNSYGLLFRNCVDFIRDMFITGGLGSQISSAMQWLNAPVNHYAATTDWLEANGFGPLMTGIRNVVGQIGELGQHAINAATSAWNGLGDIVGSAYGFVSSLSSSVGGFTGGLASSVWDFFRKFGKDHSVGDGDEETEGPNGFVGDDALIDTSNLSNSNEEPDSSIIVYESSKYSTDVEFSHFNSDPYYSAENIAVENYAPQSAGSGEYLFS